jgi:DNA-binding transcriptional LysR family regulator
MLHLSQIDFKLLLCLNALLKHQNVSRAADEMNMSQPAMSRSLARLRELFNDPLFTRTSHGMEPTSRAVALTQPLQLTLEQLNSLLINEDFSPLECSKNFRLHMSSYTSQAHLGEIASNFYKQAPKSQLEILDIKGKSLQNTNTQTIDLALTSQTTFIPDYFHRRYLGEEKMHCFMSKNHPLANKEISLDNFLDYQHIVITLGSGPNMPLEAQLSTLGKSRSIGFRTPHYFSALEVVSKTQMLLSTSPIVPQRFLTHFGLVRKQIPFDLERVRYFLCWPTTLHKDPANQWFRDLCAQSISNNLNLEQQD